MQRRKFLAGLGAALGLPVGRSEASCAPALHDLRVTSGSRPFVGDRRLLNTVNPHARELRARAVVSFRLERPARNLWTRLAGPQGGNGPSVRVGLAVALVLLVGVGSGCGADESDADPVATPVRVERCTERFLERVEDEAPVKGEELRRYVRTMYCERFGREGWIYEDGSLSIDAYLALASGGSEICMSQRPGEAAVTVPCAELRGDGPETLDCAILHFVRKREVEVYVEELLRSREVECDDGTPLTELGADG